MLRAPHTKRLLQRSLLGLQNGSHAQSLGQVEDDIAGIALLLQLLASERSHNPRTNRALIQLQGCLGDMLKTKSEHPMTRTLIDLG